MIRWSVLLLAAFVVMLAPPPAVDAAAMTLPIVTLYPNPTNPTCSNAPLVATFTYSLFNVYNCNSRVNVTTTATGATCTVTGAPPASLTVHSYPGTITVTCTHSSAIGATPTITLTIEVDPSKTWINPVKKQAIAYFNPLRCCNLVTYPGSLAYAARVKASTGERVKCFKDADSGCTNSPVWGYYVPPPRYTEAQLVLKPADSNCATNSSVVGSASLTCTADLFGKPTSLTLTVSNFAETNLTTQAYYVACSPNYMRNCPTLDSATTPYCGDGIGIGYGVTLRKACYGSLLSVPAVTDATGLKTQTVRIAVNPLKSAETGCGNCTNLIWAVKEIGTFARSVCP